MTTAEDHHPPNGDHHNPAQELGSSHSFSRLTAHERELVEQLKKEVVHIVEKDASLIAFCNDHTYVRYLRARQWNLAKASKMLKHTLEWRLEYKPHLIKWEEIEKESVTGKQYVYHAKDKAGRPIVFMRPRNENTKGTETQVQYLVYNLEHASRLADEWGVGKMCWLLDFQGYSMSNAPPIRVSMHCNSILANHYPERLGQAVCYHAPTLFSMTWKAVQPFIDPVTKAKIVFVDKGAKEHEQMDSRFPLDQIEKSMGGSLHDSCYDHAAQAQRMKGLDGEVAQELAAVQAKMAQHTGAQLSAAAKEAGEAAQVVARAAEGEDAAVEALAQQTKELAVAGH